MKSTYRVGVIGSTGKGDYGHGLDQMWKSTPRTQLVAVADDNAAGLAKAAARLGLDASHAYSDYRQMLDREKPDLVAIATRWIDRHAEMAIACAERGIHVYMEKPFVRTLAEADAVIRACEMTHARLALAHTTRYSPRFQRVRELLANGAIGEILELRGRGKEDRRGGAEDLWVLGSHIMNLIAAICGPPKACHAAVTQAGKPIGKTNVAPGAEGLGPLAGDDVRATYFFDNAVTATFQSRRNAGGNPSRFALQIYGTKGMIEILTGYLPEVWLLEDPGWCPGRNKTARWRQVASTGPDGHEPVAIHADSGNVAAANDLIEAIDNGREPLCSAKDGRVVVEMILAVFESQRTGQSVKFPLESDNHPLDRL